MKLALLPNQSTRIVATFSRIQKNWVISFVHKFVLLMSVASIGLIAWNWNALPPAVPLWYSRPWGTEQLAPPIFLFILPVGNLLWYSLNILIATYVTSEYLIFTQVLFLSSAVLSALSFTTLAKIVFLMV